MMRGEKNVNLATQLNENRPNELCILVHAMEVLMQA
jgi:hypothetical protein